jgi:terminase
VGEGAGREVTEMLPAPRERTDTLPRGLPERTLGYHAAAWMMDNLIQPNGPRAGQPFIPTDRQITFLAHFYSLNHKGNFVYRQGIRRLSKGSGKASDLRHKILTTGGWKTIGTLREGDYVFHPSGKPTMVTQVHPIGQWDTWEVEISDGTVSTFTGEHLFTVDEFVGPSKRKRRTLDVRTMAKEGCFNLRLPDVDKEELRAQGVPDEVLANVRNGRTITSVRRVAPVDARCITVAAEDGLYLVGETMVVTHNSPFAAALCLFELLGPCRFDGFDIHEPFGVRAKPMSMPLVQVVAVSESQTANTMRMVRAFCQKKGPLARKYDLEPGKTFIETPSGGKLQQMTSSATSMEGGEVSFVVGDELEHWLPAQGGPAMLETIQQNAAKMGGRFMGTCNAWIPGEQSSGESIFEAWCDQEDGLTRGKTKILYDARIAPPNTVLTDEPEEGQVGLTEALEYVYEDCPWVNLDSIKEQIWSPEYPESRSIRFFLNRPNAAEASWITLEEWTQLRKPDRKVEPGEKIVMFFDGSKSNDHTALVGCCMEDGHIFKIGHWRPEKPLGVVNVAAVDAGVRRAFDTYDVVAFWADVREWESFTRTAWPEDFGDRLIVPAVRGGMSASPIAWDMRSHAYQFAEAAETAYTEILQQTFTHDGDSALGEHVSNCRVNEFKGRWSVKKESPKSSKKIDLAVCMIGARMLYRHVKSSKEWADMNKPTGAWTVIV